MKEQMLGGPFEGRVMEVPDGAQELISHWSLEAGWGAQADTPDADKAVYRRAESTGKAFIFRAALSSVDRYKQATTDPDKRTGFELIEAGLKILYETPTVDDIILESTMALHTDGNGIVATVSHEDFGDDVPEFRMSFLLEEMANSVSEQPGGVIKGDYAANLLRDLDQLSSKISEIRTRCQP